ncbi:MAG: hypothetical protein JST39_18185, partial [Bacteroidetes bacterium]|nr:hypothetical protein [Bacteroidota bacterium]
FRMMQNNLASEYSIRFDYVRSVFEDREHNLWVCTNKGLYRFNPSAMMFHTILNRRLGNNRVFASDVTDFLETQDGHILISTWGAGIFSYDKNFNPVKLNYVSGHLLDLGYSFWAMYQRPNGDIWYGKQDGSVYISHPSTGKVEEIKDPSFNGTIRQIEADKYGNIWLGSQGGGIIKYDTGTRKFARLQKFGSFVWRLYPDPDGNIWAGTRSNGLYKISSTDGSIMEHFGSIGPPGKALTTECIYDILKLNDSIYVVACEGLNILNTRTHSFTYFTTDNGLPSNVVKSVIKDSTGTLWCTTEGGLCAVNLDRHVAVTFTPIDGIRTRSFNEASCGTLSDGRIVFGTYHDAIVFSPREIMHASDKAPPDITLTGITLMNKSLKMDSVNKLRVLELSHDATSLIIQFSSLNYLNDYAIFYKMEGLGEDWKPSRSNEVVYSHLPPGTYKFQVYCKDGGAMVSKNITELRIKVKAPFWQT